MSGSLRLNPEKTGTGGLLDYRQRLERRIENDPGDRGRVSFWYTCCWSGPKALHWSASIRR